MAPAAAVAVLALGMGACATGSQPDQPAEGPSFEADAEMQGELSIMGFNPDADEIARTRTDIAIDAVEGADPNIIEGELDVQQFLSSIASGEAPDLIYANRNQLGTFASRNAILPLDSCLEAEGVEVGDFREPAIEQATFNDSLYGLPEFNQVQIIMANGDLLEQEGLTTDDVDGSDWEAVAAANEKLSRSEGGKLSVIGFDSKLPEFLPLWAKANGTDLISEDGRTAQLDDPKVVEALEFAVGIYEAQGGFGDVKAFRDSADFFGAGNQFASNTLGAMPMEQWYVNILNDVSPEAPMAFTTFKDQEGEPLSYATGSAWAIPAGGSNPAAACRFLASMTKTDTWLAAAEARASAREEEGKPFTGLFTGNREADEEIRSTYVDTSEALTGPWAEAVEASYTANENSFSQPATPADAEFEQAWMDGVNRVLTGEQTPEDSLAAAQEEAQAALDEAWAEWDDSEAGSEG
ncbi:extracellular solute-binding protein [Zhihengliuella alba]|uniref:Extracellular solute-binding protein n=1 Tax=Zhihengliuella alba TaxID=547018 RepID=A0ABP7E1J4_9MICC